jgi:hypothetical protein
MADWMESGKAAGRGAWSMRSAPEKRIDPSASTRSRLVSLFDSGLKRGSQKPDANGLSFRCRLTSRWKSDLNLDAKTEI